MRLKRIQAPLLLLRHDQTPMEKNEVIRFRPMRGGP